MNDYNQNIDHEVQPLLSNDNNEDVSLDINTIYTSGSVHEEPSIDNDNELRINNEKEETLVPSYTLTINTNIEKSANSNVLNSSRSSAFPKPLEDDVAIKFYGGPVSDLLCVQSGKYEIDREKYVDILFGDNEDPFTLETFKDLIYMYSQKKKDFIIARIRTSDPSAKDKYFYSYYDAHHINKVLFRTQPELSLLHRMQAKNPLNNMIIVGDVHYFVIKADYAKNIFKKMEKNNSSTQRKKSIFRTSPLKMINDIINEENTFEGLNSDLVNFYCSSNTKNELIHNRIYTSPSHNVDDLALLAKKNMKKVVNVPGFQVSNKFKRNQLKLIMKPEACKEMNIIKTINEDEYTDDDIIMCMRRKSDDFDYRKRKVIGRNYSYEILNDIDVSPTNENNEKNNKISSKSYYNSNKIDNYEIDHDKVIFRAEFYATDDDFLINREVRNYFSENSLEEKDSVLFTISNSSSTNENERVNAVIVQHPLLSLFNYTFFDNNVDENNVSIFSNGIKWLIFSYFLFAFLLIKIWISTVAAILIVLIGVIFMLFLYLVLY